MKTKLDEWNKIEAELHKTPRLEYCRAWGAAREAFFSERGAIFVSDDDRQRLRALKNKYKGERIFIVGNGPSINRMPLHLLKDEFTFGVNRIYLLYDRITWRPTFYTANDWRVVPDVADEINALTGSTFFFDQRFRGLLREGSDVYFYEHAGAPSGAAVAERGFSYDLGHGARGAGSVIGSAIQIAFHLGFDPIYLIGCDLGYRVSDSVVQEGEDRFGNGVKLHLTSTLDDDPNHFDPRYFGAGRRWHDPNVKRMVEGHIQCHTGVLAAGRRIYNATVGGDLAVYERVDFVEVVTSKPKRLAGGVGYRALLKPDRIEAGPWGKDLQLNVNEAVVAKAILDQREGAGPGFMVDVGAHHGSSLSPFTKDGWRVLAFEPDPANRAMLEKNLATNKTEEQVTIRPVAISDKPREDVPYFSSAQSSGVSGLSAFLPSHSEVTRVQVTTLRDELAAARITSLDYLKIDVEGFELFALQGLDWDTHHPDVCMVEFEDEKTVEHGYTTGTLADFLHERGYMVYVLEWHAISAYGVDHSFKRFYPFDRAALSSECWGNLLAIDRRLPIAHDRDGILSALLDGIVVGQKEHATKLINKARAAAAAEKSPPAPKKSGPPSPSEPSAPASSANLAASAVPSAVRVSQKSPAEPASAAGNPHIERPGDLKVQLFDNEKSLPARHVFESQVTSTRFAVELQVDSLPRPASESFTNVYPEMPFIIAGFVAHLTSKGCLNLMMDKEFITSIPIRLGETIRVEGVHEPSGDWVLWINGVQAASGAHPIAETPKLVTLGAGYLQRRLVSGRVLSAGVEVSERRGRTYRVSSS